MTVHFKNSVKQLFLSMVVLCIAGSMSSAVSDSLLADPPEENVKPDVMLAHKWKGTGDITGWWMSEKLDGVRGYWTGSQMVTRSGNLINAPEWFISGFPPFALDGELWAGRKKFSGLSGIIRKKKPDKGWESVRYCIFDVPCGNLGFEQRLQKAKEWFDNHPSPVVTIVEQTQCNGREHLENELRRIESLGGEGLIVRRPGSLYSKGRSTDILKVKTFHDMEAVVVGHKKGSGRNRNRLGALLVELPGGVRFAIGTGFSDDERENPPPVGTTITFRYTELNASGIPRFASFLRVRDTF